MTEQNAASGWDKGKAEAAKRFGKAQPKQQPTEQQETTQPADTQTGPAAGIAEARRRFGNRK